MPHGSNKDTAAECCLSGTNIRCFGTSGGFDRLDNRNGTGRWWRLERPDRYRQPDGRAAVPEHLAAAAGGHRTLASDECAASR